MSIEPRRWGWWEILRIGLAENVCFKVKLLSIDPGKSISLQYHNFREEFWIVIQGKAEVCVADEIKTVKAGYMVHVPVGAFHKIRNVGQDDLLILELQKGEQVEESDIVRLEKINEQNEHETKS